MSVSTASKSRAKAQGQKVSGRHYVLRFRCPVCGKRYAKRTLFVSHIGSHRSEKGRV